MNNAFKFKTWNLIIVVRYSNHLYPWQAKVTLCILWVLFPCCHSFRKLIRDSDSSWNSLSSNIITSSSIGVEQGNHSPTFMTSTTWVSRLSKVMIALKISFYNHIYVVRWSVKFVIALSIFLIPNYLSTHGHSFRSYNQSLSCFFLQIPLHHRSSTGLQLVVVVVVSVWQYHGNFFIA